jgi:hypothetical protein
VKLYHPTMHSTEILRDGFGEESGTYLTETDHSGVWLFDRAVDNKVGGGEAAVLLELEIPEQIASQFEWVISLPYRQFLMPAALLNRYGRPRVSDAKPVVESPDGNHGDLD